MPTLAQIRNRVDTWLTDTVWPRFVTRQNTFFANRGRYWQGLITHSSLPIHTNNSNTSADLPPDKWTIKAVDEDETWAQAFPGFDPGNCPAAFCIDNYDGPLGKGWQATVYISHNGTIYTRTQNSGPESHRTKAWAVYPGGPLEWL